MKMLLLTIPLLSGFCFGCAADLRAERLAAETLAQTTEYVQSIRRSETAVSDYIADRNRSLAQAAVPGVESVEEEPLFRAAK